jgi:hypothetical protein
MLNVASMIGIDASKTELVVAVAPQNVVRKDGEPPGDLVASGVGRTTRIMLVCSSLQAAARWICELSMRWVGATRVRIRRTKLARRRAARASRIASPPGTRGRFCRIAR